MKEFHFKINGTGYKAHVAEQADGQLIVTVNGRAYQVELPGKKPVVVQPARPAVAAKAPAAAVAPRASQPVHESRVVAPLPGTISKVLAKDGQEVKKGDVLVVMEAMKMANDIVAEADGVVKKVLVTEGQSVNQGEALVDFQGYTAAPLASAAATAAPAPVQKSGASMVEAPLPGTVKQILVKPGDKVNAGDTVLTMEAMKMENSITAEFGGTVKAVLVAVDAQVNQGDALVEIG